MKLCEAVVTTLGRTRHLLAGHGQPRELPPTKRVEIVDEDGAIYLYRYDANERLIADTWHEDLEAAKKQAAFEFGLKELDWVPGAQVSHE
jgi:YD repeat-containing protein